jgi:hypothetical protein
MAARRKSSSSRSIRISASPRLSGRSEKWRVASARTLGGDVRIRSRSIRAPAGSFRSLRIARRGMVTAALDHMDGRRHDRLETDYFGEPFEAPEWRAPFVERVAT